MSVTSAPSQFRSNYKAMVVNVRAGHKVFHPVTGVELHDQEVKPLVAEFGVHRGEYTIIDPNTGEERQQADIRGYWYDLDADAESKGWSADEKEAVRRHLIQKAGTNPDYVQIYEAPTATRPWPTYDEAHHFSIPKLAQELGLVEDTLAYEQANKNRESVVGPLQKLLVGDQVEELTAA